ncbi:MAG: hypothetical protein V4687_15130 [Bacteroidota bacterium]
MAKHQPKLIEKTDWKYKIKFSILGFLLSIIVFFFAFRNQWGFQIHQLLVSQFSITCVAAWSFIWYFAWALVIILPFILHQYISTPRTALARGASIFLFNVLLFSALSTIALLFSPSFSQLCTITEFPDLRISLLFIPTAIVYTLSILFETSKQYPRK